MMGIRSLLVVLMGMSFIAAGCGDDDKKSDVVTPGDAVTEDVAPMEDVAPAEDVTPAEDVVPMEDVAPAEDVVPTEAVGEEVVPGCVPECVEGFTCVDGQCVVDETEFEVLVKYLEGENGNYMNDAAPKAITAPDVMAEGLESWYIIDLRAEDKYGADANGEWKKEANGKPDFEDGHIQGAHFVELKNLVTHAEENLTGDEKILVVCHTGQLAGHGVVVLQLLGHDAWFLKWGMSSWNAQFDIFSASTSSNYSDSFVFDADPGKNEPAGFPTLETGETTGEAILAARIAELLAGKPRFIMIPDLMAAPDDFYIVNYWPEADYLGMGHIEGAHQYTPKNLTLAGDLPTLPADKMIAVYCYSGQVGSQVAAFLYLLGYDAFDVKFGTNGMIYDTMTTQKWPGPDSGPAGYDFVVDE